MPQLSQIVSSPVGSFAVLALAAYLEVQGDAFFQSDLRRSFGTKRLVGLSREQWYSLLGCPDRGESAISSVAEQPCSPLARCRRHAEFCLDKFLASACFSKLCQREPIFRRWQN